MRIGYSKLRQSTADIIYKLTIFEAEADETLYWLELLVEAQILPAVKFQSLMSEVNEIVAMTVTAMKTLHHKQKVATTK